MSPWSRGESSFLFNNLVLLAACFTVLWGTLFPVLSEFVQGSKVTMGAPFYNRVAVPIGIFLLFLTGVGPLLAWRSTSLRAIRRNFVLPCIAIVVTAIVLIIAGVRPWSADRRLAMSAPAFYALVCIALGVGVITAIAAEFLRGANVVHTQTGKNLFESTILLTRRNTRRYGGYLIHFGVVVMFIGLAGSAFNQSKEAEMSFGDSINVGGYKVVCQSYSEDSNPNYDSQFALLDVYHNGKMITRLAPERRVYFVNTDHAQPSTVVAIHSTLENDLYVVFEGTNPDNQKPIIKFFINPLVNWIWVGVVIVIFGTFIALVPPLKPATRRVEVPSPLVPDPTLGGSLARSPVTLSAPEGPHV